MYHYAVNQAIDLCDCASAATEAKYEKSFILMAQKPFLYILVKLPLSSRDQVCDYLFIQLRPLIYIHVKSTLF